MLSFKRACEEACTDRLIMSCFVPDVDVDETMIPQDILAWYGDEDDEEDTFE